MPVVLWLASASASVMLLVAGLVLARLKIGTARAERDRAMSEAAAVRRLLGVSAAEFRCNAMALMGHAEQLVAACRVGQERAHHLRVAVAQALGIADDVQDRLAAEPNALRLNPEPLLLAPMLEDAIASVSATLGPSQRQWRLKHPARDLALLADRRALAEVLSRVLSNSALRSRDGDWIEIGVHAVQNGVNVTVEDEGTGLLVSQSSSQRLGTESRGVGFGLVLASSLMEAHDGTLRLDSAPRAGTRVDLHFPSSRVVSPLSRPALIDALGAP
ncbi:MAG: sensor histidine kinase [Acetobacteraceae bacterium]|nr:sensor histidine kinase [Acetobacteraceae bacterium]